MTEKLLTQRIRKAIKANDLDTFTQLIDEDRSQLLTMTPFGTWLHVAAAHGKLEIIQYLIDLGADINVRGGILGGSPLERAASKGHTEIVLLLLASGAEIDVSEPERNPLFSAIYGGHQDIVEILVQHGIDYRKKYTGETMNNMGAIEFAKERGQTEILNFLKSLD